MNKHLLSPKSDSLTNLILCKGSCIIKDILKNIDMFFNLDKNISPQNIHNNMNSFRNLNLSLLTIKNDIIFYEILIKLNYVSSSRIQEFFNRENNSDYTEYNFCDKWLSFLDDNFDDIFENSEKLYYLIFNTKIKINENNIMHILNKKIKLGIRKIKELFDIEIKKENNIILNKLNNFFTINTFKNLENLLGTYSLKFIINRINDIFNILGSKLNNILKDDITVNDNFILMFSKYNKILILDIKDKINTNIYIDNNDIMFIMMIFCTFSLLTTINDYQNNHK